MSIAEKVYALSPPSVQSCLISIKGAVFSHERFGGNYNNYLAGAIARAAWCRDQLEEYQLARMSAFLQHAYRTTSYYKQVFDALSLRPDEVKTLEDLKVLPALEKSTLREQPEIVRSTANLGRILPVTTSGTTGTPIRVGYFKDDMRERFALLFRFLRDHGVTSDSRSVRLSGRTFFVGAERNRVFWRYNAPRKQLFMSTYFLSEENLSCYVRKLVEFKPILMDGYPSAMYIIARYMNQNGLSGSVPLRVAMPTGETLEDHYREEIVQAFPQCVVVNQYASAEGAPFITENTAGELVVNMDSGIFEFVRPGSMEAARPGEVAEMVVTSFTTRAFPLIRYRIGDMVLVSSKERSSTWDMPVVDAIHGRQEDIVFSPYRGYVGRLSPALKVAPASVKYCQVAQVSDAEFELRVVPGNSYQRSDVDVVVDELKARLGPVGVRVLEIEQLERSANGKLRAVVGLARSSLPQ